MRRAADNPNSPGVAALAAVAVLATVGCEREKTVVERRAPKGVEVILGTAPEVHEHGGDETHTHGNVGVEWRTPQGWTAARVDNPTRLAVFTIDHAPGAEVVVTRFPGDVGGTLANVNRWRAQIGLGPVGDASLSAGVEPLAVAGFDAYLVVAVNEGRAIVAAGLHEPARSRTWFVKATTGEGSFERVREDVVAFARTFRALPEGE